MMAQSGSKPGSPDYIDEAVEEIKARLPERVDNYTQLSDVKGTRNGFEYTLRLVHSPTATVTHDWLERTKLLLAGQSCDNQRTRAELDAGLTMNYVVRGKDNRIAGRFFISEAICQKALSPVQQSQSSLTLPTIE